MESNSRVPAFETNKKRKRTGPPEKWAFNWFLKFCTVSDDRIVAGSLFHVPCSFAASVCYAKDSLFSRWAAKGFTAEIKSNDQGGLPPLKYAANRRRCGTGDRTPRNRVTGLWCDARSHPRRPSKAGDEWIAADENARPPNALEARRCGKFGVCLKLSLPIARSLKLSSNEF